MKLEHEGDLDLSVHVKRDDIEEVGPTLVLL